MEKVKKMVLVPFKLHKHGGNQGGSVDLDNKTPTGELEHQKEDQDEVSSVENHHVVNPLSEKLLSLDSFMEKVLKDDKLNDNEKMREYGNAMQSYMEYKKKFSGSTQLVPVGTTSGVNDPSFTPTGNHKLNNQEISLKESDTFTNTNGPDEHNNIFPSKTNGKDERSTKKPFKPPMLKTQYDFSKTWLNW
jgi:hypothetical protein